MSYQHKERNNFLVLDRIALDHKDITLVRDDLFPEQGGGNKARKALEYEQDVKTRGANALVTTGGVQSNHCRAIAALAARNGWKCHIVYHGTRTRFEAEKGNALLVRLFGATYEFVEASEISSAMVASMDRFRQEGDIPFYVTGGGHDIPGGSAYVKAVLELKERCERLDWRPTVIFHASGTGSTQAGLIVGLRLIGWNNVPVIGISVARKKERGTAVIAEFIQKLAKVWNVEASQDDVRFVDDYLCGGYEQTCEEQLTFLEYVVRTTGVCFDPTYSGKALWGAMQIIQSPPDDLDVSRPLFWHTGGLMNILK